MLLTLTEMRPLAPLTEKCVVRSMPSHAVVAVDRAAKRVAELEEERKKLMQSAGGREQFVNRRKPRKCLTAQ
jgi:hypothetical protein